GTAAILGYEPARDFVYCLFAEDEHAGGRSFVEVLGLALSNLEATREAFGNNPRPHLHIRYVLYGREHLPTALVAEFGHFAGEVLVEVQVYELAAVHGSLDVSSVAAYMRRFLTLAGCRAYVALMRGGWRG